MYLHVQKKKKKAWTQPTYEVPPAAKLPDPDNVFLSASGATPKPHTTSQDECKPPHKTVQLTPGHSAIFPQKTNILGTSGIGKIKIHHKKRPAAIPHWPPPSTNTTKGSPHKIPTPLSPRILLAFIPHHKNNTSYKYGRQTDCFRPTDGHTPVHVRATYAAHLHAF